MQVDTHNKEFQDALNLIQYTRQSVFLTGKAGTGKSTFLKYVCEVTKKKHIVLAPTGIAAINAGGSTLHSFFKLPFYPLLPDDPKFSLKDGKLHSFLRYTSAHRKLIKEIELVIIDEISMVRADIIDFIDKILRVYSQNMREKKSSGPGIRPGLQHNAYYVAVLKPRSILGYIIFPYYATKWQSSQ